MNYKKLQTKNKKILDTIIYNPADPLVVKDVYEWTVSTLQIQNVYGKQSLKFIMQYLERINYTPEDAIAKMTRPNDITTIFTYLLRLFQQYLISKGSQIHNHEGNYYIYHNLHYNRVSNELLGLLILSISRQFGIEFKYPEGDFKRKISNFVIRANIEPRLPDTTYFCLKNQILITTYCNNELFIVEKPHTPNIFSTSLMPIEYTVEKGKELNHFQHLNKVFEQLTEIEIQCIQTFLGSCILRKMKTEKCLYIFGQGGTGKSTFSEAVKYMLGSDLCSSVPFHAMMNDQNMVFAMRERILNISNETTMKNIDLELFKSIVSKEKREFRRLYTMPEEITDYPRQMIVSNNYPVIDNENAIARRLAIVEFKKVPSAPDVGLLDRIIRDDLPMLFKFMLKGALLLKDNGSVIIPEVTKKIIQEVKEYSPTNNFMNDMGIEYLKNNKNVKFNDFYQLYCNYCNEKKLKPEYNKQFSRNIVNNFGIVKYTFGNRNILYVRHPESENPKNEMPF